MIYLKNKSQTYSIDIYIQYSSVNIFSFHDLLKDIFFSLAYFIVRIQYILYIIYKVCLIDFVLSVRLLFNSRLSVAKFLGLLFSCVRLFGTLQTAAHEAPLFFTISWSLLRFMSTESVMLSSHLILCHPLLSHSLIVVFYSVLYIFRLLLKF